ncbi:MAG: tRNA lysidine(34) synthetase TilS [Flavobacteriaceae bacterium]|nr:tRNA lysidine(34) synthetase TilS [Flavobacteriaceae bacterium]
MLSQFKDHINTHFRFLEEKKLLLACSGGVDSVILTHLCHQYGLNISLAHCNFSLRDAESDADQEFVVDLAKSLKVKLFLKQFDTKAFSEAEKISTQMAARELRYSWFNELCNEHDFQFVLTAHHLDDNLETFLINLSRGTGLKGLIGIPEVNVNIVRPLLPFSKSDILNYARNNALTWRDDSSNKSDAYLRNKMRLKVIPSLKETNPVLLQNFSKTQDHLNSSQNLIDDYMAIISSQVQKQEGDTLILDCKKLLELPNTQDVLYQLLHAYGFTQWQDIYQLLSSQSGKQVFSENYCLLKNRENLILTKHFKNLEKESYEILQNISIITDPITLHLTKINEIKKPTDNTVYLDIEKLNFPLSLRKWKKGDLIYPTGMQGKKKLSKFFKDQKLSLIEKEKTWLLCSNENIVWIVGQRLDRRFAASDTTVNKLKIDYII